MGEGSEFKVSAIGPLNLKFRIRSAPISHGLGHTWLAHTAKMLVHPTIIIDEGGISLFVLLEPIADVLPQLEMLRRRPKVLVGQRAEETVAIP